MRNNLLIIITLFILQSCNDNKNSIIKDTTTQAVESVETIDTVKFNYTRYRRNGDTTHLPEMLLIKHRPHDTITFTCIKEEHEYWKFGFINRKNHFELITKNDLVLIDSITLPIQQIKLYKYEVIAPAADGDGAYFFNPDFGLVAGISYSWGNRDFLNNWSNKDSLLIRKITDFLTQDTSNIWRAKYPPPPEIAVSIEQD